MTARNPGEAQPAWRLEADEIIAAQRAKHPLVAGANGDPGAASERHVKAGSITQWLGRLADSRDSSATMLYAENADLIVLQHGHRSRRGMDAWILRPPNADAIELRLLITPGWPSGTAPNMDTKRQARDWATTNVYACKITYPDNSIHEFQFDVSGRTDHPAGWKADRPQFATASPVFPVDTAAWAGGVVRIEGSPIGSAGPLGYVERRQTNLRL